MLRKDRREDFGIVPTTGESEEWMPVAGYVGSYEISSWGRIRSLPRTTERLHHGKKVSQPIAGRFIRIGYNVKSGHANVGLSKNGTVRTTAVHVLVAAAFIGPRPPGLQVCHNDGIPAHNWKSNLRYDTPVGNGADRKAHGTDAIGTNNPSAKLTEVMVSAVLTMLDDHSPIEISKVTGIPRTTVSSIKHGRTWSHFTGIEAK